VCANECHICLLSIYTHSHTINTHTLTHAHTTHTHIRTHTNKQVKKQNYLEIGRVCLINYGPEEGKLCVILDLIDQTRVCNTHSSHNAYAHITHNTHIHIHTQHTRITHCTRRTSHITRSHAHTHTSCTSHTHSICPIPYPHTHTHIHHTSHTHRYL